MPSYALSYKGLFDGLCLWIIIHFPHNLHHIKRFSLLFSGDFALFHWTYSEGICIVLKTTLNVSPLNWRSKYYRTWQLIYHVDTYSWSHTRICLWLSIFRSTYHIKNCIVTTRQHQNSLSSDLSTLYDSLIFLSV